MPVNIHTYNEKLHHIEAVDWLLSYYTFKCAAFTFTQWAVWKSKHSGNFNTSSCVYSHILFNSFTELSCPWKKEAVHGVFCCDRNKQAALVWVRADFSKMGRMWCFCLVKKQLSKLLKFSVEMFRPSPKQAFPEFVCHDGPECATFLLFCSSGSFLLPWNSGSLSWIELWSE